MEYSANTPRNLTCGWLPDVNVWLALCSDRHEFHGVAIDWLAGVLEPLYFCRLTQMALLRLLTNPKVMGEDLRSPEQAIDVYRELTSDERIQFAPEPSGVESLWFSLMTIPLANGSTWTDGWLAAFSLAHGSRLVSFDSGMRRWTRLDPAVLSG